MKRIYLDQNHWINLMKAREGRDDGAAFEEALLVAREGVVRGLASFPLSIVHYMETYHRGHWPSRHALADTMAELSRFHTIASQTAIVPAEIDRALRVRFGRPLKPRPLEIFGVGLKHATGDDAFQLRWPGDIPADKPTRLSFERDIAADWELAMLRGPAINTPLPWLDPWAHMAVEQNYQQREEEVSKHLKEQGWGKGDKLRRAMLASALIDILDPLTEAVTRAGLAPEDLFSLGQEDLTAFLQDVGSRWVLYEMRRDLHARGQHESGDIRDLAALSIAVAHCDVVVTERQWAHVLIRANVDEMMGTRILSDVRELPEATV